MWVEVASVDVMSSDEDVEDAEDEWEEMEEGKCLGEPLSRMPMRGELLVLLLLLLLLLLDDAAGTTRKRDAGIGDDSDEGRKDDDGDGEDMVAAIVEIKSEFCGDFWSCKRPWTVTLACLTLYPPVRGLTRSLPRLVISTNTCLPGRLCPVCLLCSPHSTYSPADQRSACSAIHTLCQNN